MVQTCQVQVHHVWCMPTPPATPRVQQWRLAFGARLRQERERRHITQETLAHAAGVDRKLIYRTELGQTSPRLDAVVQIADALGIKIERLLRIE